MITRIEVDGFKSLRNFALDLEPFTALVGPNGAGKSNIFDVLALLATLASGDLATALQGGRGWIREQFSTLDKATEDLGWGRLGTIDLAVELLVAGQKQGAGRATSDLPFRRLRYEANIELQLLDPNRDRCVLRREKLATMPAADPWLDRHPDLTAAVRRGDGSTLLSFNGSRLEITDPLDPAPEGSAELQHVRERAFLADPQQWAHSPHLQSVANELRGLRVAHLEPERLRAPSDRSAPGMTARGDHLARQVSVLAAPLPNEKSETDDARFPGAFGRIRARFVALIPGVRTLEVAPSGHTLEVVVELTDGQRFAQRVLSDGTLRVLGLLTLIETVEPGTVLAIEEPENGMHPSRARALLDILRETATADGEHPEDPRTPRAQIVVTSHSPAILAALMDRPQDIVVIDMVRDGAGPRRTRARTMAAAGASDRGELAVSRGEIERMLATAAMPPLNGSGV